MIIAYKHPFVGLFVMSCGTCCFVVSLWPFCFIAVTWPKMANRPNKQPKETRVYRKVVRFIEDLKMKTLCSIFWLSARAHKYFSSSLFVSHSFHYQSRHQFRNGKQL